ncbi:hypothetical protein JB92DRAFT_2830907 [Gautieria morchelliformis]|nr:hypothetical protein JB92DRAFT_2830907 [Gautieria morchelliformis]
MPSNAPLIYPGHRWTGAARADRAYISAVKRPPHGVVSNIVNLVVCICCLGAVCLVSFHLHVPIRKDETYPVWPLACGFIMTLSLIQLPEATDTVGNPSGTKFSCICVEEAVLGPWVGGGENGCIMADSDRGRGWPPSKTAEAHWSPT